MDKLPEWTYWGVFACLHGLVIGLVAGCFAAALGAGFWPWFAGVALFDAGGVAFNVWTNG